MQRPSRFSRHGVGVGTGVCVAVGSGNGVRVGVFAGRGVSVGRGVFVDDGPELSVLPATGVDEGAPGVLVAAGRGVFVTAGQMVAVVSDAGVFVLPAPAVAPAVTVARAPGVPGGGAGVPETADVPADRGVPASVGLGEAAATVACVAGSDPAALAVGVRAAASIRASLAASAMIADDSGGCNWPRGSAE